MPTQEKDPFARHEDGTAKDPKAFQEAIRSDPVRLEEASKEQDPSLVHLVESRGEGVIESHNRAPRSNVEEQKP